MYCKCSKSGGIWDAHTTAPALQTCSPCSVDNVGSCAAISNKKPLQALEYPPTPAPETNKIKLSYVERVYQRDHHVVTGRARLDIQKNCGMPIPMRERVLAVLYENPFKCHAMPRCLARCRGDEDVAESSFTSFTDISPRFVSSVLSETIYHRSRTATVLPGE